MKLILQFSVAVAALFLPKVTTSAETLVILPGDLTLDGPKAAHQLLVQRVQGDRYVGQVHDTELTTSDPEIVAIDGNVAVPKGNGTATITAKTDGMTAKAKIEVTGMQQPFEWSFRNHVQSVFTKAGCNSGACHGALAGKGGFKLSLRGYDTKRDWETITRQARGRRIELADPGRSLILAKPSGAIPHKGGLRFEVDSPEYRTVAEWIASGAAPPKDDDPQMERLEIVPDGCVLKPGDEQQFLVRAHFSDGRVEDVTRWAKFNSANQTVAKIDDHGKAAIVGHGEGAVTAWYLSKIVIARITSPYPNKVEKKLFAVDDDASFIDKQVMAKLQRLNLPPSPEASDDDFIRRAYVETIGVLPTADEVREFLSDDSPDKRDDLIDELLERPEFVDYWSYKWSDLFLVSGEQIRPKALRAYYEWIRQSVAENKPWDQMAREIVTAKGSSYENGATNFYALHQDPLEMSENTSVAFLGLNINCARCHNHPLEKWTNDQYYAMANLFARVRAKGWGGDSRSGDGLRTVYVAHEGDLIQPLTGKPQPPTPLDGEPLPIDSPEDRREHLADWLTSPENPYFARAIANRIWANYFGVGLVEPVDDLRISNPASHEELLSAAADFLIENDYDLKALMRVILQSDAYQRSSRPLPGNAEEKQFYSRYYPRRLMAEVLLDGISQVTGVPTPFAEVSRGGAGERDKIEDYPLGTRALELRDSAVISPFLTTFGRNERMITCACERSNEPSMTQVLHISNGDTINQKLAAEENRISEMIAGGATNDEIIEEVYLAALSRYPRSDERERLLEVLDSVESQQRRVAIEDLYWGLLSSREFLFNH